MLAVLRDHSGEWVDGMDLMNAAVGGTRAGGRIEELRKAGWNIESRPDPRPYIAPWQYRLIERPVQLTLESAA